MKVSKVKFDAASKRYRLSSGVTFQSSRFCCLGPGEDVVFKSKQSAYVKCKNGKAQVFPIYKSSDSVEIGGRSIRLVIKEIETEEELSGYHQLEEYHYRGKSLHGRRVPLIVTTSDPLLPLVLGYIELSTAFIMSRPRALLLNDDFRDEGTGISWTRWEKDAVRKYTNLVVRIARTVVSPEFRGLGLAGILVHHAIKFSKKHWHVGCLKPFFLEITADMLRYIPFVESAGMHYIGDTEGNLARVNGDMNYLLRNSSRIKKDEILKHRTVGILDLQLSYAALMKRIQKKEGMSREHILRLLLRSPDKLSDENWTMLHQIFRLPKPTFLIGLRPSAERFVRRRIRKLALPKRYPSYRPSSKRYQLVSPIDVKDCTLTLSARLTRTRATRKIQEAFGVSRDMLTTLLFANISFTIKPGDIVLICGPSGAGKTSLLSLLKRRLSDKRDNPRRFKGSITAPHDASVRSLNPLPTSRPLVNSLGRVSFEHALFALNVSGLAEAHLYVKRFSELSNGQRYRAMVAKLIASTANIWIADEFCATLDPITANIVSRNLRKCARQLGVTVVVASANWREFVHELRPDTVIHLRAPWDHRIFSWPEFQRAVEDSQWLGMSTDVVRRPKGEIE